MKNNQFSHLHLHNEYSYLDGYGSSKKYIARAKELGFNYIALTNHGNIDGLLQWQKECDKQGIHPILGCEAYIVPDRFVKQKEIRGHISLLIRNETGWKTLCSILTEANLTGFYHRPRIDYKLLLNNDLSGLIIMTACAGSFLNLPGSTQLMEDLVKKTDVYFEIMPHNITVQTNIHNQIKKLSEKFPNTPFVATNDCHYIEKDEWESQEMLLAINSNASWDDPKRWKFGFKGLHLRTADEMVNAFQRQDDWPEDIVKQAMANTIKIARQCFQFRIPKQEISLPSPPGEIKNNNKSLEIICEQWFQDSGLLDRNSDREIFETYMNRYHEELKLIKKKKFERYFLIVFDLINWARDNNIAVGPGRGSVGGSLIAFLMNITQIDPIKFKLSFSRFISEERQDLPDIDIDFEKRYRGKVIEYLEKTYGKYNTCGISTDMKMQSRAAIRNVCRVMNIPSKAVSSFANSIWQREHNNNSAIQSSIDNTKEGKYFAKRYPDAVRLTLKMEGQIRGCLSGDTRLVMPNKDRVKLRKIKYLFSENYTGLIRMYDFDKKILVFGKVRNIYQSGIKEVFLIKLTEKISIKATSDHRFLTKEGWKKLSDIQEKDFIATNGFPVGNIPWNKGLKGNQEAWNKGLKGVQVAWNKGLTKKDHPSILAASKRWEENNPGGLPENRAKSSKREFKHGLFSRKFQDYLKIHPFCEQCGKKSTDRHHIDKNRKNNSEDNLMALCSSCHAKIHAHSMKINPLMTIKWSRIISITGVNKEMTYDISMDSQHQNFVANKVIVHNSGAHAAAVIISKENLSKSDKCVLIKRNNRIVCNWNMEDSEYVGLMKLDVLGLSTLSVLSEAKRLINKKDNLKALFHDRITDNHLFLNIMKREFEEKYKNYTQIDFNFNKIPLEDEETFEKISAGETSGMFQLSGRSCTELCKKIKIHSFDDIIAIIALARPGPADSGMTDDYIARKHGKKWEAMHPIYEEVTKDTYGLLVYQEQVMQVISKVAGLSESTADEIRKVIGKKRNPEEFEPFFKQFLQGCKKMKTLSKKEAEDFWEGLLNWASYGFNRCLTGDTLLTRSSFNQYTGRYISIEKLYLDWNSKTPVGDKYRTQGLQILQMCDDKRCRPGRIIGIFYQRAKTVYRIITKTGKEIKGTYNHRLLTFDGYKKIEELSVGERLAIMGPYQQTITEKKGQKWKKVYTKGKEGFQKGQNNPSYIDGRTDFLEKAKKEVLLRSGNKCEKCLATKSKRFEFAHIKSLEECSSNYQKYHSKNNILYLCNNCHKKLDYVKGERKRRYSKGYPIYYDSIISIERLEKEDVFDIEMESPFHNFIANDIVSHNSHATAYALIGYWTAYLKTHCEKEFYAASLTYGEWNEKASDSNKHKNSLLSEIRQAGYTIILPKREYSDIAKWVFHDEKLYIPFTEIIGVGESNASKCLAPVKQNRLQGFFGADYDASEKQDTKINQLLKELKVDESEAIPPTKILKKYLPHIDLQGDKTEKYPNLTKVIGSFIPEKDLPQFLTLTNINSAFDIPNAKNLIQRIRFRLEIQVHQCNRCGLRKQVKKRPVLSSVGLNNVSIILEAPGKTEDEEGRGAVGQAGNVLWNELAKYEYFRRFFHLTNCCRCWPSKTKTPTYSEIAACYKWLHYELNKIECRLILACGNIPLYALTGRKGGIMNLSGTTEWVENVGAWVCWSVHPSAVLRNRGQNLIPFQDGIKNFIEKLGLLR